MNEVWQRRGVNGHLFEAENKVNKRRIWRDDPLYCVLVAIVTHWLAGELQAIWQCCK